MRYLGLIIIGLGACAAAQHARAADTPAIIIPGKAGVPVMIYGGDASYCVVEGDYGLDRPGHVPLTVYACPVIAPPISDARHGYYPAIGRRPGYGRFEIEPPPNRRLPPPAQDYHREWGTQSDTGPAAIYPPANSYLLDDQQIDELAREARDRREDRRDRRSERFRDRPQFEHRRPHQFRRH